MKVLLITQGSRGDVQPFAALAHALVAVGHQAILYAPAASALLAESHGLHFIPSRDTWDALTRDPVVRAAFETNYRGLYGKTLLVQIMRRFRKIIKGVLDDLIAVAGHYPDVIVYHPILPGHEVAERLEVPAVPVCLEPAWVPTESFTNPLLPFRLPAALNRVSYQATRLWVWGFVGSTVRWRRETLQLPRRRGHSDRLVRPDGSPATVLQAFSRHLLPPGVDYPSWVHTTGFWSLPAVPDWRPPPQLSTFLDLGPPPVYLGFGSLVGIDPCRIRILLDDTIRLAGVRAIVTPGQAGDSASESSENLLYLDEAPFEWLFPRMAAIVHHGGAGTTAAALASGRPQVVSPAAEPGQRFNAWRMHSCGLAPAPTSRLDLTPEILADSIRRAVSDPAVAARAARFGRQIRAEEGVGAAIKILESL